MDVKRLSFQDIFTLGRILQKTGKEATLAMAEAEGNELVAGIMAATAFPAAENEIVRLVGSLTGQDDEAIRAMSPVDVLAVIESVIDQEDLEAVFTSARRLAGKLKDKMPKSSTPSATATDTPPDMFDSIDQP